MTLGSPTVHPLGSGCLQAGIVDASDRNSSDIGLRVQDGGATIRIAVEPAGTLTSPLRIAKNGTIYSIVLVEPSDPSASHLRVKTAAGPKAWAKLP